MGSALYAEGHRQRLVVQPASASSFLSRLSEFVESTVRGAVEHRLAQSAFAARADEAWARFQRTGAPAG